MRTLSHDEARRVYDRIGAKQDTQAFYEDVATRKLVAHSNFGSAESVFEFGCGTGRFAEGLLREHLGAEARYRGIDLSETMVGLATIRLAEFGERAAVRLTEGGPPASELADSCDRFVSNFVFDLLSNEDIAAVITEAHRMLRPGGLICLSSLSPGHGPLSRGVIRVWSWIHRLEPRLVGGCRAVDLAAFLEDGRWKLRHRLAEAPFGLPLEVVIAERT